MGLPPRDTVAALQRALLQWQTGNCHAADCDEDVRVARGLYAGLVGVPTDWIAIHSTVSGLVSLIAASLPPGSTVLCAQGDFTSLLFPFLQRAQSSEIQVVEVPLERIADATTKGVNLVAVSAVQSANGCVADLGQISARAKEVGAATLVDGTQAIGWLPLDATQFDFVVTAAYKWLLAPRGVAFLSVRPDRLHEIPPLQAGWYAGEDIWSSVYGSPLRLASTARRLDVSPAWLSWAGAACSLRRIAEEGVNAIYARNIELANSFLRGIGEPESNSAIVSLSGGSLADGLNDANIACSIRNGATRFSFHFYNTEDEVALAVRTVKAARG